MTKAQELLNDLALGRDREKEARESAVLELSGLMSNRPVRREDIRKARPTEEPMDEDDKDLQTVKAAVELFERDPEKFRRLVLEVTNGEPVEFSTPKDRQAGVLSLASMVQQQLANGGR